MRLYQRKAEDIIRIRITQLGLPTEYFTVWECTMEEAHIHFQKVLANPKLPMQKSDKVVTSVQIRDSNDGKLGKAKTVSFKGLTPKQTKEILIESLNVPAYISQNDSAVRSEYVALARQAVQ